jgi:hypothetical protein
MLLRSAHGLSKAVEGMCNRENGFEIVFRESLTFKKEHALGSSGSAEFSKMVVLER